MKNRKIRVLIEVLITIIACVICYFSGVHWYIPLLIYLFMYIFFYSLLIVGLALARYFFRRIENYGDNDKNEHSIQEN